jgi:hypothetical protein
MSDLSCAEAVELVTDFLDQALNAETQRRFAGHLRTCDGCQRYVDQYRWTIRILGDLPGEGTIRTLK